MRKKLGSTIVPENLKLKVKSFWFMSRRQVFTISSIFLLAVALLIVEQAGWIPERTPLYNLVSVIAYSWLGVATLFSTYKMIDWLLPADIEAEIFDRKNIAASLFKGLLLVCVAIIIAAVLLAP